MMRATAGVNRFDDFLFDGFGLAKLREEAASDGARGSGNEPGVVSDTARVSDVGVGWSGTAPPTNSRTGHPWR